MPEVNELEQLQKHVDEMVARQMACNHVFGAFVDDSGKIKKSAMREIEWDRVQKVCFGETATWFTFCPECGAQLRHTKREMEFQNTAS